MTFWYGPDPGPLITDPADPDPAFFFSGNKNLVFFSKFFCLLLFEGTFTLVFIDKKVIKESQNSRNQSRCQQPQKKVLSLKNNVNVPSKSNKQNIFLARLEDH